MTKPRITTEGDLYNSFDDTKYGIGQRADGNVDVFPLADLAERMANDLRQQQAFAYAMEQSEKGFPGGADADLDGEIADSDTMLALIAQSEDHNSTDISDLDDYDDLA